MSNVKNKGVVALPVTVGVLFIVLVIGATLAAISFSELFVTKTGGEAKTGFYLAEFGMQDALMKITRGDSPTSTPMQYNPTSSVAVTIAPNPSEDLDGNPTPYNPGGINTKCNESQTPKCTCDYPEESCEANFCLWDGGSCKPQFTHSICSEATITGGAGSQKTIAIQVIADIDEKGKVTQCEWTQL